MKNTTLNQFVVFFLLQTVLKVVERTPNEILIKSA